MWKEEFYHCLDTVRDRVQETGDGEQLLEMLGILEDFFETWAEKESACKELRYRNRIGSNDKERNEWKRFPGELRMWQAESEAEIFRTGTLLLIAGLEQSGSSYEFIYDGEADRQDLINIYEGTETDAWSSG